MEPAWIVVSSVSTGVHTFVSVLYDGDPSVPISVAFAVGLLERFCLCGEPMLPDETDIADWNDPDPVFGLPLESGMTNRAFIERFLRAYPTYGALAKIDDPWIRVDQSPRAYVNFLYQVDRIRIAADNRVPRALDTVWEAPVCSDRTAPGWFDVALHMLYAVALG